MTTLIPILLFALRQRQVIYGPSTAATQDGPPPLTGKNGYEEYCAAAKIANSQAYQSFERFTISKESAQGATYLDTWREQVRRFSAIGDLVVKGNSKEVFDPKPRAHADEAPELAGFPGVADYFVRSAYLALANGDSETAERNIETILLFVNNLDNGTEVSGKTAEACGDHVFKALKSYLPKFGVLELDRLADAISQLLALQPSPINTLQAIRHADVLAADEAVRNPVIVSTINTSVESLSPANRERTIRQFVADEDAYLQSVMSTASLPEAKWETVLVDETDPVATGLAKASIASSITPLKNAAQLRTKLRIVRLMVRCYRYKWYFDKFPESLAIAVKGDEIFDPLSGEPFRYSPQADGIEIASVGTDWTGPIHLAKPKS